MKDKEFIVLMAFLMSVVAISIDAMLPALGIIGQNFGVTNANHTQYIVGGIFVGMAAGQLFWGPLSDALGRKKVLYSGIVIYLIGSLVCYLAPTFPLLLVGRLIQGVGVAAPYVTSVSVVRDKYAGRQMARIMSVVMMIFILVPAIAPSLGQGILYFASWREIFLMYLIYAVMITIWIWFRLPETLTPEHRNPLTRSMIAHGFREVLSNRVTVGYTFCMGICFGSFLGYLNSSQQIFHEQFGTGDKFAIYFGCLALVLGVASLTNSRFVEKLGMYFISVRAFSVIVLASAIFLGVQMIVPEIKLWMFLSYAVVLFFSFGLVFGNLNATAMEPMGHIAGIASAIIGSVSSLISMSIGAFIGQLYNGTLVPMTIGFLVLGSISTMIIFMVEKDRNRVKAQSR